jgi:hypothetical protein
MELAVVNHHIVFTQVTVHETSRVESSNILGDDLVGGLGVFDIDLG